MYVITRGELGRAPMLSGFFAGMLGGVKDKTILEDFLTKVRNRPQDHKRLLLNASCLPGFARHRRFIIDHQVTKDRALLDCILAAGADLDEVIEQLRQIGAANLKKEIEAEQHLWDRVEGALGKVDRSKIKAFLLEPKQLVLLEQTLLDPRKTQNQFLANSADYRNWQEIGIEVALRFLDEYNDMINSEVSEANFGELGRRLAEEAISIQEQDQAFKKVIDRERKRRREQAAQELKRKQRKQRGRKGR